MLACSSSFSSALYRLRSLRRVRIMIIAVTPESKRTMARELRIENQWICHVDFISGSLGKRGGDYTTSRLVVAHVKVHYTTLNYFNTTVHEHYV